VAEVTIALPPGLELLSLNGRDHWAKRHRVTRDIKEAAWAVATRELIAGRAATLQRAEVTVTYQPPDRRRRDADNLALSGKAAIDGLVLAGVLPDDSSRHVAGVTYEIGPVHPRGRLVITVREIQESSP
jgi:Holliday junction resolvase RusA-like endonuclease